MNSNFYQKIQLVLIGIMASVLVLSPVYGFSQSHKQDLAQLKSTSHDFPWSDQQLGNELTNLRNRTTKQYETSNGTVKAFSAPSSIHYMNSLGQWTDIDLSIKANTANKHMSHPFSNVENAFHTYYSADPISGTVITETSEGVFEEKIQNLYTVDANNQVVYSFESNAPAEVLVEGSKIIYTDVFPNADIAYTQGSDGRKFDLILKNEEFTSLLNSSSEKIVIEEKMTLPEGWNASYGQNGIDIHTQNGVWITNIPMPSAFETQSSSKVYSNDSDLTTEGEITFTQNGIELIIKTYFSLDWINDSERIFPISLDPTVNVTPENTTFWTGRQTSANGTKSTGFLRLSTATTSAWARFNLSTVPAGVQALNAIYHGYHYTTTGTPDKISKIVGLGTLDPVTASVTALYGEITSTGPSFNTNYDFGGSVYQWRDGVLDATGLTNIATDISTQGWTALGFAQLSGSTTFMYHYGHDATGVGIPLKCYLELEYALLTSENDAGVATFDSPQSPVCAGSQTGVVTIQNFGINQISPVTVNWTVNGTLQTPVIYTGVLDTINGTGSISAQVTLGTFSITSPTQIIAWTSMPNNVVDTNNNNDSVIVNLAPALSGNYIIGSSGSANYASFNAAVTDLEALGICGPVVFDVEDGLYAEQVDIDQIDGATDTNTITFRSLNQDSSLVTLEFSSSTTANNYIFRYSAANNIILEGLTLHNSGATYATVLDFVGNCDSNTVRNCRLYNDYIGTGTTGCVIYTGTGSTPEYNTFQNNLIEGGSYGVWFYGSSTTVLARGIVFENNTFLNQYFYGSRLYYLDAPVFRNNTMTSNSSYATGYGMYFGYCDNELIIEDNHLYTSEGSAWPLYGMYIYYCDGTAATSGRTINNIITLGTSMTGASSAYYAFYPYYNDFQVYSNNTITVRSGSSTSRSAYLFYCDFYDFNNNLVTNYGDGLAIDYNYGNPLVLNNNGLYTNGSILAEYDATVGISSLEDLQLVSGQDLNSLSVDPMFVDTVGGIHCSFILNNAAQSLTYITEDFYGTMRTSIPDIGAVEYMPGGVFDLGLDSLLCQDSVLLQITDPFNSIIWSVSGFPTGTSGSYLLTTNNEAETYTVNVIATTDYCGTAYSSDNIILVPNISLAESAHLCPSESVVLDAQGGFNSTYSWYPTNETTSTIDVSESGIYIGQKNEFGCISVDTTIVTASQAPSIDDQMVCTDDLPLQLDATVIGGTSYSWSAGSSTSTAVNTVSDSGNYSISIQDSYGCDYVHEFHLEAIETPSPSITTSVVSGNAYTFVGSSSSYAGTNSTYTWTVSPGGVSYVGQVFTYVFPWSNNSESTYTVSLIVSNDCGDGSAIETVTPSATGIDKLNGKEQVSLYPNPASEILHIDFTASQSDIKISLLDLSGRIIAQEMHANSTKINVSLNALASGTYLVQISTNELGQITKPIVVR